MAGQINGFAEPFDFEDEYARLSFIIREKLAGIETCTIVKVIEGESDGEIAKPGTLTVQPIIQCIDGRLTPISHGEIYNVPYVRLQAGKSAIIMDPQKDDIGVVVFTSRDSSKVKATKEEAPPGSTRMFDMSDAIYIMSISDTVPETYIRFTSEGDIEVASASGKIKFKGNVEVEGQFDVYGSSFLGHGQGGTFVDGSLSVIGETDLEDTYIIGLTDIKGEVTIREGNLTMETDSFFAGNIVLRNTDSGAQTYIEPRGINTTGNIIVTGVVQSGFMYSGDATFGKLAVINESRLIGGVTMSSGLDVSGGIAMSQGNFVAGGAIITRLGLDLTYHVHYTPQGGGANSGGPITS